MDKKLTEKQRRFIDYYIELGNATEAAIRAGYNKKTAKVIACQNLTKLNPEIQAKMQAKDNERIASQDEVLRFLTSIMRNEEEEEVVVVENIGNYQSEARIITKKISVKDRIKAAEDLGKRYALFSDKVSIDGVIPIMFAGEDSIES